MTTNDGPAQPATDAESLTAARVVVVTGSTRGIGYGLANAFLAQRCAVVINGRTAASVDAAVQSLAADHPTGQILGASGDIGVAAQVQALWDATMARFGRVDIWINNAGLETARALLWDVTPAEIDQVVTTNLAGTLHGCRVAIRGMAAQGGGYVYNMEGFGSDGRVAPGLTTYAATKAGITYLTNALVEETKDLPVKVGSINPGMVLTDMLRDSIAPDRADNARRIFNILADTVDTVTPWLADKVLANDERGAHIVWLTKPKIFGRFLMAPFRKRDIFALDDAPSG